MCAIEASPQKEAMNNMVSFQEMSTMQKKDFNNQYVNFIQEHQRAPYVDELRGISTEKYLKNNLRLSKYNGLLNSRLFEYTGKPTILESNIYLNDKFRDLDVSILPLEESSIVTIQKRPSEYDINPTTTVNQVSDNINSYEVFKNCWETLYTKHGIKTNLITSKELFSDEFKDIIQYVYGKKGFIYNGDIYLNLDNMSVDTPLHELTHLLVGSLRFKNPELYQQLVSSVEQIPGYEYYANKYVGRTRNDINEEIFVDQLSKLFSGEESELSKLDENTIYEINYNINRILDSVLMGSFSTKSINMFDMFNLSLKDVATIVNSSIMANTFDGSLSKDHRLLNNLKSSLLKSHELEEICE